MLPEPGPEKTELPAFLFAAGKMGRVGWRTNCGQLARDAVTTLGCLQYRGQLAWVELESPHVPGTIKVLEQGTA